MRIKFSETPEGNYTKELYRCKQNEIQFVFFVKVPSDNKIACFIDVIMST